MRALMRNAVAIERGTEVHRSYRDCGRQQDVVSTCLSFAVSEVMMSVEISPSGRLKLTRRGEGVLLCLQQPVLGAIGSWIAEQPDPKPKRQEAIQSLVLDGLAKRPPPPSEAI
jgi:hypothetical protein